MDKDSFSGGCFISRSISPQRTGEAEFAQRKQLRETSASQQLCGEKNFDIEYSNYVLTSL
jgi:hypothetical protein